MKLVPLADRVVLKQKEAETKTSAGIIIAGAEKEKPQQAEVIAVGPGGLVDGKERLRQTFAYLRSRVRRNLSWPKSTG